MFKAKDKGGLNMGVQVEQSELDKDLVQVKREKMYF